MMWLSILKVWAFIAVPWAPAIYLTSLISDRCSLTFWPSSVLAVSLYLTFLVAWFAILVVAERRRHAE